MLQFPEFVFVVWTVSVHSLDFGKYAGARILGVAVCQVPELGWTGHDEGGT